MSADGAKLAAGTLFYYSETRNIHTSTDNGVTWSVRTSAGIGEWRSIASSTDGMKLVAGDMGNNVHISYDGGISWTPIVTAGKRFWWSVACSAAGTVIFACVITSNENRNGGSIWRIS